MLTYYTNFKLISIFNVRTRFDPNHLMLKIAERTAQPRPVRPSHTGLDCLLQLIVLHLFPQVVDIMRVNVDKVLERDQKLSELDDRADALQAGASQFETSAAKLKNKYWWKNAKVRTCRHA